MYQVTAYNHTTNTPHYFGPLVTSLEQARIVVKVLDWMLNHNQLPPQVWFYNESTVVQAIDTSGGQSYNYVDSDPSGASDGIWDKV